jgi:hypothetical protein
MILAAFSFIRKISMTTTVSKVTDDYIEDGRAHILQCWFAGHAHSRQH